MRWKRKPPRHKVGEMKVVHRFVLFPRRLGDEWRWLEWAWVELRWYAGLWGWDAWAEEPSQGESDEHGHG